VDTGKPYGLYTTTQITSNGGNSGGPLCVQFEGGSYYPAAIYLGGAAQTVVRAIDSDVINLFTRAEASSNGGGNSTGGGATGEDAKQTQGSTNRGFLSASVTGPQGVGWQVRNADAASFYRTDGSAATVSVATGNWVIG